jgi:ferrous iron transport protein B
MSRHSVIAVVGNPNCGKTTLFNALTGARQRVGNWPGVTVERKTGRFRIEEDEFEVVDLPGTYSLDVTADELSLDEKIARDYAHGGEADLLVNIVDASNLERNLYLTSQLLEMKKPLVVALNMTDVASARGVKIDTGELARRLDCPVVPIVASRGKGIQELKRTVSRAARSRPVSDATIPYDDGLSRAINLLIPRLAGAARSRRTDARWLATRLLEGDDLAHEWAGDSVDPKTLDDLRGQVADDVDILLADGRYGFANRVARNCVRRVAEISRDRSDRIDRVILNRALGIPVFLAVMYLMFMFTINLGGAFIDFFDILTGTVLVDGLAELLSGVGSPGWLTVVLADGIGGGIRVVATFIPVIGFLYLFLSVLEDSGYMARAAFVMDRFMRAIGLPGKAFVPLIVGFGCNVPAVMAARTLEHRRDRILTVVMTPFMSCGARLSVYALFATAFFASGGQNLVFAMYLIGIGIAVLTGLVMTNTLLRGEPTPFVMELPPYHLPTVRSVLLRTWDRTKSFVFRAGKVIVPMVLVLNLLNAVGIDGSIGNDDSERSVLSGVGRAITPAFAPMGLDRENWPAAVGIFTGVLAKEAVVGTLDSIYSGLARAEGGAPVAEREYSLRAGVTEALSTVPANLTAAIAGWADPLGLSVGGRGDAASAAEVQEVDAGTYGAMVARFDGTVGAFSYLLFILLYFPCVSVIAAVYREISPGWALFVAAWSTGLAYAVATAFYQVATFGRHPAFSTGWIMGLAAVAVGMTMVLRRRSGRENGVVASVEPRGAAS